MPKSMKKFDVNKLADPCSICIDENGPDEEDLDENDEKEEDAGM